MTNKQVHELPPLDQISLDDQVLISSASSKFTQRASVRQLFDLFRQELVINIEPTPLMRVRRFWRRR